MSECIEHLSALDYEFVYVSMLAGKYAILEKVTLIPLVMLQFDLETETMQILTNELDMDKERDKLITDVFKKLFIVGSESSDAMVIDDVNFAILTGSKALEYLNKNNKAKDSNYVN